MQQRREPYWVYTLKRDLEDYSSCRDYQKGIMKYIEEIDEMLTSIPTWSVGEKIQSSGSSMEDKRIDLITKKMALEFNLNFNKSLIDRVQKALSTLDEREEKIVDTIDVRKVRKGVARLESELYLSKSEIYRIRDAALRKMAYVMYGRC